MTQRTSYPITRIGQPAIKAACIIIFALNSSVALSHDEESGDKSSQNHNHTASHKVTPGPGNVEVNVNVNGNTNTNNSVSGNTNNQDIRHTHNNQSLEKKNRYRKRNFFQRTSTLGFGSANPKITSNTNFNSNSESTLGLSLGIGTMMNFSPIVHLTVGGDYILGRGMPSEAQSRTLALTAGVVLGKVNRPGSYYFSSSAGPARTALSSSFIGSNSPSGYGRAYKMGVGRVIQSNLRAELSFLRIKDNWDSGVNTADDSKFKYNSLMVHFVYQNR